MLVYMNFLEDYRQLLLKELKQRGLPPRLSKTKRAELEAEIEGWSALKLFSKFFDNESRQVPQQKYSVHISDELQQKLAAAPPYSDNLKKIVQLFEEGKPIQPYLSGGALRPVETDWLLLHWGLNHLHVSSGKPNKAGLAERAGVWLFFRIKGADAYFVDVSPHQSEEMLKTKLVEIVDRNWPELQGCLPGLAREEPPLSEEQIATLRHKNVTHTVQTERGQVLGGTVVMSNGVSVEAQLTFGRVIAPQLEELELGMRMSLPTFFKDSSKLVNYLSLIDGYEDGFLVRNFATGETIRVVMRS